jgi:hypothetical protein
MKDFVPPLQGLVLTGSVLLLLAGACFSLFQMCIALMPMPDNQLYAAPQNYQGLLTERP